LEIHAHNVAQHRSLHNRSRRLALGGE
jgi:hypothetical protein